MAGANSENVHYTLQSTHFTFENTGDKREDMEQSRKTVIKTCSSAASGTKTLTKDGIHTTTGSFRDILAVIFDVRMLDSEADRPVGQMGLKTCICHRLFIDRGRDLSVFDVRVSIRVSFSLDLHQK